MSEAEREELEALAAEYALGTLEGEERASFEQRLARDEEARRLVDDWNERLAPLAEAVDPESTPSIVWRKLERTLDLRHAERQDKRSFWENLTLWRSVSGAAAAAAIALALYVGLAPSTTDGPRYIAVLQDEASKPMLLTTLDVGAGQITSRPVAAPPSADNSYELWLVAGSAAPISLGLVDAATTAARAIPESIFGSISEVAVLAVSLEPAGGSPTGQPTGPVIWQGPLLRADP